MFDIKRNTTPVLPITVEVPLEKVREIEFVFKSRIDPDAPALVKKEYNVGEGAGIPVEEGDTSKEFTVLVKLDAKETMKLISGEVHMDTRIVLTDGDIPYTDIVSGNIKETLFGEVYGNEKGEGKA